MHELSCALRFSQILLSSRKLETLSIHVTCDFVSCTAEIGLYYSVGSLHSRFPVTTKWSKTALHHSAVSPSSLYRTLLHLYNYYSWGWGNQSAECSELWSIGGHGQPSTLRNWTLPFRFTRELPELHMVTLRRPARWSLCTMVHASPPLIDADLQRRENRRSRWPLWPSPCSGWHY